MKSPQAQKAQGGLFVFLPVPMLFYLIYSSIMWKHLNELPTCTGFDKNGVLVNATEKWMIMTKLVWSTSLIGTVTCFFAGVFSMCQPGGGLSQCCSSLASCNSCAFIANFFVIPYTIFASYSKPCYETVDPITGVMVKNGPYSKEYFGFRTIWITMLSVSGAVLLGVCCVCIIFCCIAGAAMASNNQSQHPQQANPFDNIQEVQPKPQEVTDTKPQEVTEQPKTQEAANTNAMQ